MMKSLPWILGVTGGVVLAGALGLGIWAGMPANPLTTFGILVLSAGILTKMVYLGLVGLAIWIAALGVACLTKGRADDPSALAILSFLPPGLGLSATLLAALSIARAMQATHTTELVVIAPSLAEALAPLGVGLMLGAAPVALRLRFPPALA